MSSGAPFVAPWSTDLGRRASTFVTLTQINFANFMATVPDGQWWRIVLLQAGWNLSAVVAERQVRLQVNTDGSGPGYVMFAARTATASQVYTTTWAPNVTAFSSSAASGQVEAVQTIPDVIWPARTVFFYSLIAGQAGDGAHSINGILVEPYMQDRSGVLVPLPAPVQL